MRRYPLALVLLFACSVYQFGQTPRPPGVRTLATTPSNAPKIDPARVAAEKLAKQVTLSEQVLNEVQGLRLGENRAHVYAKIGAMLWKSDPKTAKDLFQRAVNDMLNAQMAAESEEKNRQNGNDLRVSIAIRPVVLTPIGGLDAEFALESLYRTRTPAIQRALLQVSETVEGKVGNSGGNSNVVAQNEFMLEQRLIRMAAEQNPERASKLLQESIKKGLSSETLSLLKKLYEKDPESADSLAAETMDKLLGSTFSTDPTDQKAISLSQSILNDSLRVRKPGAKELTFTDSNLRSLANKIINYAISAGQNIRMSGVGIPALIKFAEKYSPGMVTALKKLEKANMPPGTAGIVPDSDSRKLMESSMPASQLVTEAKKLPAESRAPVYQNAAMKMARAGDYNAALDLINANFTGRALENAINQLNWAHADYLINQGKYQEAERLIDDFPLANRLSALINLAQKAFAKNAEENKTYSMSVLQKVRSMLPNRPSDNMELIQFTALTSAYAPIEPSEAFSTFEPVIPMLNELVDANAIVQAFQSTSNVRSGEFVLSNGGFSYGFFMDPSLFRNLAKADFERTTKLIDNFARREMRINLKLQLAENGLN